MRGNATTQYYSNMLFISHHSKSEKAEIKKAKRQLLIVGVICITTVIFIIWLMGIDNTFERNRQQYKETLNQNTQKQLSQKLQEIKQQIQGLR